MSERLPDLNQFIVVIAFYLKAMRLYTISTFTQNKHIMHTILYWKHSAKFVSSLDFGKFHLIKVCKMCIYNLIGKLYIGKFPIFIIDMLILSSVKFYIHATVVI